MSSNHYFCHEVPMPRTEQEIRSYLRDHDAAFAKYEKMSEEEKAIYTKCLRIGVPYRCHPKQGYTTYMLDGIMAVSLIKQNPDKYPIPTPVAPEGYVIDHEITPYSKYCEQGGITVGNTRTFIAYDPCHNFLSNSNVVRYLTSWEITVENDNCIINHSYNFYVFKLWTEPDRESGFNRYNIWKWKRAGRFINVGSQITNLTIPIQEVIDEWSHRLDIPLQRTNKKCNSNYFKICMCDINQDAPEAPKIALKTADPKPEAPMDQKAKRRAAALKAWATMRAKGIR